MTENTSLFGLLTICSFAFDCPKVENLMKTFGEKYEVHIYIYTHSMTTTVIGKLLKEEAFYPESRR